MEHDTASADALNETTGRNSPIGSWSASVVFGDKTAEVRLTFEADGTVRLATPVSTGEGTWTRSDEDDARFGYRVKEVFDDKPGLPGSVDIEQDAVLSGPAFTSSGTSVIRSVSGTLLASVTADVSARREGGGA
ncbi:hypothetical protein ACGFYU_16660 [Streptomyces sp. NPDC048337]|uniref:hypothetical protein n=1 Tax=Streptomyces sp. NPDC048337 TaxID=3365535 RepID=UPI00371EFF13